MNKLEEQIEKLELELAKKKRLLKWVTALESIRLDPKEVKCMACGTEFEPVIGSYHRHYDEPKRRAITCHVCGRRYFEADQGTWESDRALNILEVGP